MITRRLALKIARILAIAMLWQSATGNRGNHINRGTNRGTNCGTNRGNRGLVFTPNYEY